MKRLIFLFCLFLPLLASCGRAPVAEEILSDFLYSYPLGGTVYSSERSEGEEGYVTKELLLRVFDYDGQMPNSYAFVLNPHPERGRECGVFITDDATERELITELCERRIAAVGDPDGRGIIIRSGRVIAYSTDGGEAAERIFSKIIAAHT